MIKSCSVSVWKFWRALALLLAVFNAAALAQEVTGNIAGTVIDGSGAAVPGAAVVVSNTNRNREIRRLTTDQNGSYVAPLLPVGLYSVSVESPGFKKSTRTNIQLSVNEKLTVNFSLELGSMEQEITIAASALAVESQTAQISGLISGTQVRELSLNNRHFAQLLSLMPGVSANTSDSLYVGSTNPTGGNNLVAFSVNGNRQSANNWTVDGADILDRGANLTIMNYPSVDAIEEVKVVRSPYSSEFGRSGGGQVNVITRSGTSALHGSAYEFFRNDAISANNFFNNANGIRRPPLRYNNFGYTVGGPIVIPGKYGADRSKTFFFWSQEYRRVINYNTVQANVPTTAELQGQFPAPVCIGAGGACTETAARITNINPAAQAYITDVWSKIPLTNSSNQLFSAMRGSYNHRQDLIKIDHNIGSRLMLSGRFLNDVIPTDEPGGLFTNAVLPGVGNTKTDSPGKSLVVRTTATISPTFYNEAGYAWSRGGIQSEPTGLTATANSPNINMPLPFPSTLARIPSLLFAGGVVSNVTSFGPYDNFSYNHNIFNNMSKVMGRHNLKFGVQLHIYRKQENAAGNNTGSFTIPNTPRPAGTTALQQAWANFLMGNVSAFTQASQDLTPDIRSRTFEWYVQDDFRVRPNLTLNFGVRYSNFRQPFEGNDQLSNFDPSAYDPAKAPRIDPVTGNIVPGSGDPLNGLIFGGGNSPYGRKIANENNRNFAPRFGFAWDPFGRGTTSVRGGYGIFYDTSLVGTLLQNAFTNPPLVESINISNTRLENPAAGSPVVSAAPRSLRGTPVPNKTPYTQQWSLDVQREVAKNVLVTLGYVGSKGTNLIGIVDLNLLPPGFAAAAGLQPATGYITAGAPTARLNAIRPYRGYAAVNTIQSWFNSNYHSLQFSAQKRFDHGSMVNMAYTWSKALTDSGSDRSHAPQNPYDIRNSEYGLAPLDRRHVLTVNYVYELPFHSDQQGALGRLLGGWQVSGIYTYTTGLPLTITSANGNDPGGVGFLGASAAGARPDLIGDPMEGFTRSRFQFFNTAAFAEVPAGQYRPGNAGRGIMEGPRTNRFDFSLFKNIRLKEQLKLQFRAEAFNALNHTMYSAVGTALGNVNFGRVTSARDPRVMQLGLKLIF